MLRKLLAVVVVLMVALVGTVPVFAHGNDGDDTGAVYVMTNATGNNQVIAYRRAADGSLTNLGAFDTGGRGSGVGVTVPPDPIGSQNALLLSPDGRWLFAVNAGSDEISVFKVRSNGLKLTDKVSSYGSYPVSLTYHDGLLYVLNAAGQGNITGFRFNDDKGDLHVIRNSTRSLDANTPADGAQPQILESPAQISFSPDGHFLVVTDKGGMSKTGRILVFAVWQNGRPSDEFHATNTATPVPFAFIFDKYGHLVVLDAAVSTVTTYNIGSDGYLTTLASVATGQMATCWIASNGKYLFTDNTGSGTVSAVRSAEDGSLSLLNATAANTGMGSLPLDVGISHDGRFLYSLETGAGMIGAFRINSDGSLTALGTIPGFDALSGAQGIAVW